MKRKTLISCLIVTLSLISNLTLVSSQISDQRNTGGVDIYLGIFKPPDRSIDDYYPVEEAEVKIINKDDMSTWYSGTTNQKGYLRFDGIMPGKYFIVTKKYQGDYFLKGGVLIVKEKEDSKVYLHLELESTELESNKAEVQENQIESFLPNLVGKIIEVSKSPSVSTKASASGERK